MKLSEQQTTFQVKGWLQSNGWMPIRLPSGVVQGVTRGTFITLNKKGTPDWVCFRGRDYFFLEMKATGKKLKPDQEIWFSIAKINDMPAIWADGIDMFLDKYWKLYPI